LNRAGSDHGLDVNYEGETYGLVGVVDVGDENTSEEEMSYDETYDPPIPPLRDVRSLTIGELVPPTGARRMRGISNRGLEDDRPRESLRDRLRREHEELEQAIVMLAGQMVRRTNQLEHLERYPEQDPFPDGTRLEFTKRFPNSETEYSYLALRAGGRWHLTGARSPQNVTWDRLVNFMGLGVEEVWKIGPRGGRKKVIG